MQNKSGFIPKSLFQPHYYQKYFDLYAGVYIGKNNKKYFVQIDGNIAINRIDGISLLRQDSDARTPIINKQFKTIKSAINHLQKYFESNNL